MTSQHSARRSGADPMKLVPVAKLSELRDREPAAAQVANVDLVLVRFDDRYSIFYGRCLHRGARLADGRVEGDNLICGLHNWDFRLDSGVSEYKHSEALPKFQAYVDVEADTLSVNEAEIEPWRLEHPQPYQRERYQGSYADIHGTPAEPETAYIQQLARDGLTQLGHHGALSAMGVPIPELPSWKDLQILAAQVARSPRLDDEDVETQLVIGPGAARPLKLEIPLFVSDMSFGSLSREAKVALATGAQAAGTGICSGEGGMLPAERDANSRYFYELASAEFGWSLERVKQCQAFHFKGGQGAKTGTGGHLPGHKVTEEIAKVRGIPVGEPAISPARFLDLRTPADFARVAADVREVTGGIPIGFKLSAQHIEEDLDFALEVGVDYIILDGRGGGTGAAPNVLKNNISVPTIAALARARRHLDARGADWVTLIATGGLRTESDFVKALALGADGVAISNAALQAIGCIAMRACHTNNCPVGIATQNPKLRARLEIDKSARQLTNYLLATTELMKVLARACGHRRLSEFRLDDLSTWKHEVALLTGVRYAGVGGLAVNA